MLSNLAAFEVGGPLHAMTAYNQWAIFQRTTWDEKKQKWNKRPITADGYGLEWRKNPNALLTYAQAKAAIQGHADRCLGFLFTANDPFFCLDIDSCFKNGAWTKTALDLIAQMPNTVVEVSMSNGLHVLGSSLDTPHICVNSEINAEFYTKDRLVALTGEISATDVCITTDHTFNVITLVDK